MSDTEQPEVEVIPKDAVAEKDGASTSQDTDEGSVTEVHQPAKVMRIASMIRTLLDEVRAAPLDEASRARLREIYQMSVKELSEVLSEDLKDELIRLSFPFEGTPSDSELRVAHAQLVGWLEGLFHGLQAMMFAQQMEQRSRLQQAQRMGLPEQSDLPGPPGTGQYL